jgi:hypothetical protein
MNTYFYKYRFEPNTFALGYSGSATLSAETEQEALRKAASQEFPASPWNEWTVAPGRADYWDSRDQWFHIEVEALMEIADLPKFSDVVPIPSEIKVDWCPPPTLSCTITIQSPRRTHKVLAGDIVDAILTHLSDVKLESLSDEDYHKMEAELDDIVLKEIKRDG